MTEVRWYHVLVWGVLLAFGLRFLYPMVHGFAAWWLGA